MGNDEQITYHKLIYDSKMPDKLFTRGKVFNQQNGMNYSIYLTS